MTTTKRLLELKAASDAARDARQAALDAYYLLAAAADDDDDAECAAAWKAYWAANVRAWAATDAYLDAYRDK